MENELDSRVYDYCRELVRKCQDHRNWAKRMFGKYELPAMAAVCRFHGIIKNAYSYPMFGNKCNPILEQAIHRFGEINQRPTLPNLERAYPLGNCAEQHAADKVLNQVCREGCKIYLRNLRYSIAMRPRTKQRFAACRNCQSILPNVRLK